MSEGLRPRKGETMIAREHTHKSLYEQVVEKIDANPELAKRRDYILADWPNWFEHLEWIAAATPKQIVSWVDAGSK